MTLAGVTVLAATLAAPIAAARLDVPILRQARERCGPAALEMVLRYYGADSSAWREAEGAYDPVLRGALITDLAAAARRAGFEAVVENPPPDSLAAWLHEGVPPILLYSRGWGSLVVLHYGVLVGWDPERERYTVHDGGSRPRRFASSDLERRWRAAGGRALVVRRR